MGSEVVGKGAVTLNAGNDITAHAAAISAGEALNLNAGHDVNILNGENTQDLDERHKVTGGNGLMSKTTTTTRDTLDRQTLQSSTLSGDSIKVLAGNDLRVQGSSVAGTQDVKLLAGHDLTVTGATERNSELHLKQEKKSGLMSSGGIGISYGTESLKTTDTSQGVTNQGSTVGSVNGNVTLGAGNNLEVTGSELVAGKDMALSGKNVSVTQAQDENSQTHKVEQKKSGLTLALSGTVGSALNTAVETSQQAKSTDDSRLAALQGTKAALSGVQAVQAARLAQAQGSDPANDNMVGISISYGTQSSTSTQNSGQSTAQGSSLTAGNNLSITASGNGVKGQDGDILVQGSQLQAGKDVTLNANRDVNLLSAKNTQYLDGKNESQGGTLGVGIGVGSGGIGLSISASVNKGKGNEKGNGTRYTETTVNAGNRVNITSGRDTNLIGAQVTGESVKADVGRNLLLESQQDSDRYDSKQQNASAGGSFTFGSMTGSGSLSLSKDKMHSNYDSVQEQTGIFAGKGGFDVTVGEHTQLNGAVIGSTATADKNKLDTGTLGFKDIHNQADFEVEHQSVGISSGGSIGSQFAGNMANGLLVGANNSGHDSSTTHAAVSDGTLVIRDQDKQTQNVSDLSRDVEHANQTLSPIFDKEKEQKRLQQAQLIGEIGNQAMDIARTEGDIRSINAGKAELEKNGIKEPGKDATKEQWKAYNEKLHATDSYKETQKQWGTGSSVQQGMQAATAAIQGLAGNNLAQAMAGGLSPYAAGVIKAMTTNEDGSTNVAANAMAHAVWGAVAAKASGNSALAGAAGAASGELMARYIAGELYPDVKPENLTEDQKQTLSALGTLAAGLAGGLVGDGTGDAVAGAQSGKNAVENNYLSDAQKIQKDKELAECGTLVCKAGTQAKWTAIDAGQDGSFAAGMVAGVPAGLYDTVEGIVQMGLSPVETYDALKQLFNSGDVLGNVSDAVKQSYIERIDNMEAEYQKAGASGSFNSGIEGGKLLTDIASLAAGGAGIAKGGVVLTEKIVAKVAGKAESIAVDVGKTGTVFDSIKGTQPVYPGSVIPKSFEMTLPNGQKVWVHGNATEHMAEYAASKAVTNTPEAVRLASQTELRSFQAALDTATKNGMSYGRITVDGWQLEIKPPRAVGELPTVIHARYLGGN
uniref:hemagglutinin repeat-containing protein n=1 Tax=Serratia plymuthica TaxID=82996 RepID=UPI0035CD1983